METRNTSRNTGRNTRHPEVSTPDRDNAIQVYGRVLGIREYSFGKSFGQGMLDDLWRSLTYKYQLQSTDRVPFFKSIEAEATQTWKVALAAAKAGRRA